MHIDCPYCGTDNLLPAEIVQARQRQYVLDQQHHALNLQHQERARQAQERERLRKQGNSRLFIILGVIGFFGMLLFGSCIAIGIYANNDDMALGVVEAVKNAGKLQQVTIVGTDGIDAAKKSIAKGELAATVADDLYGEGKISVDLAVRLLNCQKVPKWVVTNQALITKDNVAQFPDPPAYQP